MKMLIDLYDHLFYEVSRIHDRVFLRKHEVVLEHVLRRSRLMVSISKICEHYPTVNEALAAWPALRGLLPDEWQQLDLKFDGTPKALPDGVDIVELTALITHAKLTGVLDKDARQT